MSHNRRHSYDPRADSPPLVGRVPPPSSYRAGARTSWYRSDSPPLISRIPTPPLTARSLSPPTRTETRIRTVRTHRPEATVGTKLYNLFRPRSRRVEVVETPVRGHRTVRVQRAPTPPLTETRRYRVRRTRTSPPPPPPPLGSQLPRRLNRNHGMSPQIPDDEYIPLPDPLPPLRRGEPTPPESKERPSKHDSRSPRRPKEYLPDPWTAHEIVDPDEPRVVTESRPVRVKPEQREATLVRENQSYRDQLKRVSQELEQKDTDIENFKARLADANDRAQRDKRGSNAELDELRFRLRQCQLDRDEQQREIEQRDRELDRLRRQNQRPTVIHYDDDDRQPRLPRQAGGGAGMAAIREAQANRGRGRG